MATGTIETQVREVIVAPFGIVADHPRNSDLLIQCIPGARMRSTIDGTKGHADAKSGEHKVPLDQSRHLASFPRLKGMELHVNPMRLVYEILDPLYDDEQMQERVTKWLAENSGLRTGQKIRGAKPLRGELDVHRMKSLCREMFWLIEANEAKVCKGSGPDMEEIERLPGYFLLNPGLRTGSTQPVYEKDFDQWVDRLSHSGG